LDEAALDPEQEGAVSRQFSRQYHLVTRPERLEKIADDLVEHFINRGFKGKGMYVAIDKATAVTMHDLVKERWGIKLAALESALQQTPPLERPPLETQIEFMRSTDMAVVVSQAQNEQADMEKLGLDITPHRRRINKEDLDTKFKDPKDPFRLVFVCARWLTGFDAPSCSTLYLDKPMRNHALMQTIARANRVFPDKDNGLIVDYVGVFRSLENALNIYASGGEGGDTPIRDLDELKQNLENALTETETFLEEINVDLNELELASGFEFIALQDSAADTLLEHPETRSEFVTLANQVRDAFKALLPEPAAMKRTRRVQAIRSLAKKIASSSDPPDISGVMDSVSDLLDRSVGAKEYLIRAAHDAHALVDLSTIDFEQLALKFAQNKRLTVNAVTQNIEQRLETAVRINPTRADLAEKFRRLLREYNNGTLNVEEILKRLREISRQLTEEENRAVREDLTEEELAIFDLLTKPEPELTNKQSEQVKQTARVLLERITERLVVDWRKKAQNRAAMKVEIKRTLHESLPDAYNKDLSETKLEKIFDHVYQNYRDSEEREPLITIEHDVPLDPVETIADVNETVLARAQADPEYFAELMQIIFGTSDTFSDTTQDLLSSGTEGRLVEYKSTARWNVEEQRKDKTMEHVVAKTVAGFLNAQGGTLLIGVNDDGKPLGLDNDYQLAKHKNSDGYISWLDDMLQNALGHAGAHRVQIRIDVIEGKDVCRLDVPAASKPIWLTKGDTQVLFERRNNSTRPVPEEEVDSFIEERFPGLLTISNSL
ncbi:MAG: DUF3387 domain-containing protein, partial [Alphaproteobacteria bacterium]|nr:DUF3387 domain-containing protein [Alphaproteobacteria bacterium]